MDHAKQSTQVAKEVTRLLARPNEGGIVTASTRQDLVAEDRATHHRGEYDVLWHTEKSLHLLPCNGMEK